MELKPVKKSFSKMGEESGMDWRMEAAAMMAFKAARVLEHGIAYRAGKGIYENGDAAFHPLKD